MMTDNELAEAYAARTLGGEERKDLEKRMENDPPFAQLVREYENTLEVLKRKWLRSNIEVAKKELWVSKLVKIGIVILAVSALLFIATYKLLKPKHHEPSAIETIATPKVAVESTVELKDTLIGADSIKFVPFIRNNAIVDYPDLMDAFLKSTKAPTEKAVQFKLDSFSAVPNSRWMENAYQVFEIDPKIANEIKCKNGTLINLPANAMALKNGEAPKGMVTLSVQEYSNYAEMFKHNVTTTSDSKLLETGGSCFIKAEANGDSIILKKNQTYSISFPSEKDERMKTFIGERDSNGNLNWALDQQVVKRTPVVAVPVVNRAVREDCNCKKERYYFQTVVSDEGFYNPKTDDYTHNVLSASKKVVCMFDTFKSIQSTDIKILYKEKAKLRLRFGVDSLGNLSRFDYNFKVNKKTKQLIQEAANFVVANYQVDLNNKGAKNVILNVDLVPSLEVTNSKAEKKIQAIDSAAPIEVQNKMQKSNMNIIVARSFGYINCDFFSNQPNLTKLEVKVPSSQTDVKVFFKDVKAVANCTITGTTATFTNAPVAASVLIVGTVLKHNQLMMALKEAKVGEAIELKDFEPFDLNKIKAFLTVKP
jgi:hypothetical protein